MNCVKVRNLVIGEGRPKICAPIVGITKEEIIREARTFSGLPVEIAEWRADWFEHSTDAEQVQEVLKELRKILGEMPILFTFRTAKEGGEKELDVSDYVQLNQTAAACGYADLIDVEVFMGDETIKNLISVIHKHDVKVIGSNHDFHKTPKKQEIITRLCKMQEMGADIPKIAVMPTCARDVLTLLNATQEMFEKHANRPIITMSMDGAGLISRLCGEVFGSAVTFGAAGKASAPGQAEVCDLDWILNFLHTQL